MMLCVESEHLGGEHLKQRQGSNEPREVFAISELSHDHKEGLLVRFKLDVILKVWVK